MKAILAGLPDEVICQLWKALSILQEHKNLGTTVRQLCDFRSKEAFEQQLQPNLHTASVLGR